LAKENKTDLIRISKPLKKWLGTKKLIPNETYDHLLKRLLKGEGWK